MRCGVYVHEHMERIWKKAIEGLPLPADLDARKAIAEIVGVALTTNPVAEVLFARAEGRPAPAFDAQWLVPRVADWIRRFHPEADLAVPLDAGRTGAALAAEKPATAGGAKGAGSPTETWKTMLWRRGGPLRARRVRPTPPQECLVAEARGIVLKMLVTFHDVPLKGAARGPPGSPWRLLTSRGEPDRNAKSDR